MVITDEVFSNRIMELSIPSGKWVIGLSGGADSLCLTLLLNEYAKSHKDVEIYACLVDHKLRPESSTEILPIIEILKQRNIKYKVFIWNHQENLKGNIEQKARIARYNFLYSFCREISSTVLMTAHHALDQWETFFMRLSRGSSIKGLSSIKHISNFEDVILIRPLLPFSPWDIKETLATSFGITDYVNDPSNKQMEFERVRWRKAYDDLSKNYGLDLSNITRTIERIQNANSCIDSIAEDLIRLLFDGKYLDIKRFKTLHSELQMRIIDILINKLSPKGKHIVSYSLISRVVGMMCEKNFTATNLSGLIFRRDRTKNIRIYEENRQGK